MNRHDTFILIPEAIQRIEQIDWPHRAIWGIVYAFSHDGGECWLTIDQIAERIHRKRRQTTAMVQLLIDLDLVEVATWNGRRRSLRVSGRFNVRNSAPMQSAAPMRNSAPMQSAAHQARGNPHIDCAENRTADVRNSAHIENNLEEKEKKTKKKNERTISTKKNSGNQPESLAECRAYFDELNSNDADAFFDYWESVGWKRRTGKIVCWKSTARNWVRRSNQNHNGTIDKSKPLDATNAFNWAAK